MCRVVATFSERRSIVAESLPIDRQRGAVSEPFEMIAARDAADEVELIAETEPVVGQKCVGALRSDGEEKFVVFAAGYGGFEIDGSRDALGIDFGTYAGPVQDMPQVGGDARPRCPSWRALPDVRRARCLRRLAGRGCGGSVPAGCRTVRPGYRAVRRPTLPANRRRRSSRRGVRRCAV